MDSKLARLFDYQKYEPNSRLDSIIKDVESRYSLDAKLLDDEELEMVSAAGTPVVPTVMQTNRNEKE